MHLLNSILLTLQIVSSIVVIVLVLLQQGKGADMGAAFGSGSAGSVFGSAGAANFLSRATKWAAILFFATTGGLAWVAHHPGGSPLESGIMQGFTSPAREDVRQPGSAVPDVGGTVPSAAEQAPAPSSDGDDSAGAAATGDASVPDVPSGR